MNNKSIITSLAVFLLTMSVIYAQSPTNKDTKSANKSYKAKLVDLADEKNKGMKFNDILKKYKGQVVYMDIWASWCGPCKKEMPYSQKLKKELAGKDVAFIYVSTDKNAESWRGMIDQLEISGDHYRVTQEVRQDVVERYNLQYIPRYILINKDGKVADANAKRPSDPAILNDIDKLLL